MNLEDSLCSKTRIKILKVLLEGGQLNTSQIMEKVRCNFNKTHEHLEALREEGILEMLPFGVKIRYYRFSESPKAEAIRQLFEAWKS